MKRMILPLAAAALLAMVLCGCESGAGTQQTNPPKVTSNVTSSPAPATSSPSARPTPEATPSPSATDAPDTDNPGGAIGDAVDDLMDGGDRGGNTGSDAAGEVPQPRRGGLM